MYQHKNSVHQAGTSHLNKLGLTHRSNSLDVNMAKMPPNMQEARTWLKKTYQVTSLLLGHMESPHLIPIRPMEFGYVYVWSDATLLTLTSQISLWIIVSALCVCVASLEPP